MFLLVEIIFKDILHRGTLILSRVDLIDTDTSFHRWIDVLWKGLMSYKIYINKHFLAWFNSYHEIYLYGIEKGGGSIRILYNMIGYILNCMENLFMCCRTCLRYFLPPQWVMDKETITTMTLQELANFPLDDFFDHYEKGLRKVLYWDIINHHSVCNLCTKLYISTCIYCISLEDQISVNVIHMDFES